MDRKEEMHEILDVKSKERLRVLPRVNHIGMRVGSDSEYRTVLQALRKAGIQGEESQAPGHRRTFFNIGEGLRFEVQLWDATMPEMRTPKTHIDLESDDPMGTLNLIDSMKAKDWGEGEIPRGGIEVSPNFAIMARQKSR